MSTPQPAVVSATPLNLTFPAQMAGTTSAAQTVTFTNTGGSTANIVSIVLGGSTSTAFAETTNCGSTLAAGASCQASVSFTPSTMGTYSAYLQITDSANLSQQTVTLAGTGTQPPPMVSLSSTALTFAGQAATTTSAAQVLTITNSGGSPLTNLGPYLAGANPSAFNVTGNCGLQNLAAGASCQLNVTFTPPAVGSYSAAIGIIDNASGSPQMVSLTGTGTAAPPAVTLSPQLLNFYSQAIGTTSAPQSATITNSGGSTLNLTSIAVNDVSPPRFAVTSNCGTTLAPGASCVANVTFTPTTPGFSGAAVNITDNAAGSPQQLQLAGTGVVPPAPVVSLSASSLAFTTAAESTSAGQTVTLSNTGNATMAISGIALTGANAASFGETTTCGATLAVGANCTISVTFSPFLALTGGYSASVAISTSAAGSPATVALAGTATGTLTINTSVANAWTISTGAVNLTWNSQTGNLVSVMLAGTTDQLVDTTVTSNGQPDGLYMDNTGQGSATPTSGFQQVGNEYIDWWITYPSSATNPFTYSEHFVVTANDPGLHVYFVGAHSASDIVGSFGQVQYVFRISQTQFTNTYSNNSGLNNLGVTQIPLPASQYINSSDPGRAVSNAVVDLHGFPLPTGFTREFYTKYDYSSYEYLHQEHGLYGSTYGAWTVIPSTETLSGGPTKQDLIFTGNILMMETFSSHLDNNITYTPPQGVASSRLFGPYNFEFNKFDTVHTTASALYQEAQQYLPYYHLLYDNEQTLLANGYTPSTGRGTVAPTITNGGSATANTAWTVLSDPAKNFQYSSNGLQYWVNNNATGTATLSNVAPGTYRLSHYVLGQWGETRYDGVVVKANTTTTLPALSFTPENFGPYTPIWTIGTPDRSAHEFLHGTNAAGQDDREFWGTWNFWSDFAATQGNQIYYATAEGATPATNNLNAINYVQWGTFDPGLYGGVYNASDDTTDGYTYVVPSYVGNPSTTRSPGLTIHFTTTAAQQAQGGNVVLSVGLAAVEGSVVPTLNGSQLVWHYINPSDAMVRSGLAGYYQWIAFQWPVSQLKPAGQDNVLTLGVSQVEGVMLDALRMEITSNSADPLVTGWNDYEFVSSSKYTPANDTIPNP